MQPKLAASAANTLSECLYKESSYKLSNYIMILDQL